MIDKECFEMGRDLLYKSITNEKQTSPENIYLKNNIHIKIGIEILILNWPFLVPVNWKAII